MTKSRIRRTGSGYKAFAAGSPGQGRGSPIVVRSCGGRSDGSARRGQALPEEISVVVRFTPDYRTDNRAGQQQRSQQKLTRGVRPWPTLSGDKVTCMSALVVIAEPGEGLNL